MCAIESNPCRSSEHTLTIIREPRPLLNPTIATYGSTDRDVVTRSLADAGTASDYGAFECIVVVEVPNAPTLTSVAALVDRLKGDFQFEEQLILANGSSMFRAIVLSRD